MTNPRITRADLRAWGACWSDEDIARRVPPEGVTLRQVLEAEDLQARDRVWVAARALAPDEARRFAGRCARRAKDHAAAAAALAASAAAYNVANYDYDAAYAAAADAADAAAACADAFFAAADAAAASAAERRAHLED